MRKLAWLTSDLSCREEAACTGRCCGHVCRQWRCCQPGRMGASCDELSQSLCFSFNVHVESKLCAYVVLCERRGRNLGVEVPKWIEMGAIFFSLSRFYLCVCCRQVVTVCVGSRAAARQTRPPATRQLVQFGRRCFFTHT